MRPSWQSVASCTVQARACVVAVTLAVTTQACTHHLAAMPVGANAPTSLVERTRVARAYENLPIGFEANQGQTDAQVRFLARGPGYNLFLTPTEAVLSLRAPDALPIAAVVRMRLVGANAQPNLTGLDPLPGTTNYFVGNDQGRWQRDVPTYTRVKYAGVYPDIDLVYYGNQRQLEYDIVVGPNADAARVELAFEGVEGMSIDAAGHLVLQTAHGDLAQQKPVLYQDIDGERHPVDGHYELRGDRRVGFHVAAYDPTRPLVIDPVLSYSTYLGGNGSDIGYAITVDGAGNAYVTGSTRSTNFPGVSGGAIQPSLRGSDDVFVSKLNAAGSALVYSTYLGGSASDIGHAIAVDNLGNAYVTGSTDSPTQPGPGNIPFPLVGALQPSFGLIGDAFVTKLNAAGNALVYSTYLGGSGTDRGYGIALDGAGSAYVTGHTNSLNFPIAAAFQPAHGSPGSYDAFVSKINAAGNALVYSTYLGGNANEFSTYGGAIAVDGNGSAYVGGSTSSTNFPGAGTSTIQPTNGGGVNDGFVAKFTPAGSGLVYSTYLGGTTYDEVNGLAIDANQNAYVVGYTDSPNFPTASALQGSRNGSGNDAFVSKLNAAGTALSYSTYLGGSGSDRAYAVAVDGAGRAFVSGWTNSSNFPTVDALQAFRGSGDAFVTELSGAGTALVFSTYWGGTDGAEHAYGIALDSAGYAYLTGETNSSNFVTTANGLQASLGGFTDAFVVKFAPLNPPTNLLARSIVGNTVTLDWTPPAGIAPTGYVLEGGIVPGEVLAGVSTNSAAPTFTFIAPTGVFYLRVHSLAAGLKSTASNEIRIYVNVPARPSAPVNLLGFVNGSDLGLAWTNTGGGGVPTGLILDVTGSINLSVDLPVAETFSVANVPAGTYTLSLRATNGVASASSNAVTLTNPGVCSGAPAAPARILATASGNVAAVSWSLPASGPAPTSYTLSVTGAFVVSIQLTSRSVYGVVPAGTYNFSVVANNPCGTGSAAAALPLTIP